MANRPVAQQKLTLRGLQNAAGFLQSKIAERIETRYTPRLEFHLDQGVKKSIEVARILREVLPPPPEPEEPDDEAPDRVDVEAAKDEASDEAAPEEAIGDETAGRKDATGSKEAAGPDAV